MQTEANTSQIAAADIMCSHVITSGPAKGWVHTHGLAAHGLPELEARDVPLFLGNSAAELLYNIVQYMLDTGTVVKANQTMCLDGCVFRFAAAHPDDERDYGSEHYEGVTRLGLAELDGVLGCS